MIRRGLLYFLVFAVFLGLLTAGIHLLTQNNNLGTDFYIFWQAGRATFLERTSPYSDEIAVRSQMAIFKRLAKPNEDQLAFVYPPYALLPLAGVALLPFDWAQAAWIAFLFLALVSAFALAFPQGPRWASFTFLAFYPVFFGLVLGNFAVLICALLVILFAFYFSRPAPGAAWQIGAGLLAGWLTFKPQFTWPFLLLLLLYAIRRKHWNFIAAAAASFALLLAVSFVLVPNWPAQWLERISRYTAYNQAWPISTFLLKEILPVAAATWVTLGLGLACLGLTAWLALGWWWGKTGLLPLLAWLGFVGYLFHPRGASYEQIAFLFPLAVWVCTHPRPGSPAVLGWWLASLVVSWIAFGLSVSSPALASATEWPVLFQAAWVAWILAKHSRTPSPSPLSV